MKIESILYHPTLVKISYKIYEVSAALGFAVMPKSPKESYIEKKLELEKINDLTKNLKDS